MDEKSGTAVMLSIHGGKGKKRELTESNRGHE
jgi:hypothetical protein